MKGRSWLPGESAVWLMLAAGLVLVAVLPFVVSVLVGALHSAGFRGPMPSGARVAIQVTSFIVTKWYLILGVLGVAGVVAAVGLWVGRMRSPSS